VVELEEELRQAREELRIALERKVEEVSVALDFRFASTDDVTDLPSCPIGVFRLMKVFHLKKPSIGTGPRRKHPEVAPVLERLSAKLKRTLSTGSNQRLSTRSNLGNWLVISTRSIREQAIDRRR
jgi:hypothetical protein